MHRLRKKLPSYRLHKASGQAVITLGGNDHYLGSYGSAESQQEYQRLLAEWLAAGQVRPVEPGSSAPTMTHGIVLDELLAAYWRHAEAYYVKNGQPTRTLNKIKQVMAYLHSLYGSTPAADFRPLSFKAIRSRFIETNRYCRQTINEYMAWVKEIFRWGVENELVPESVHASLKLIRGLAKGRVPVREGQPVKPVRDAFVDAVKPHLSRHIRAMIELEELTGMRPGETVTMRGCDLDTTGDIWVYTPSSHKTEHHDRERKIYLGPKAQEVVKPLLKTDLAAYLFSPVEAEAERLAERHNRRVTPLSYGNAPGTNRKADPKRFAKSRYTVASYRRAIQRACEEAFPPPEHLARRKVAAKRGSRWETRAEWRARLGEEQWRELRAWQEGHRWHPNQLRHNAATRLRKRFGLEAARVVLGHSSADVTQIYAEMDQAKAAEIMARVG